LYLFTTPIKLILLKHLQVAISHKVNLQVKGFTIKMPACNFCHKTFKNKRDVLVAELPDGIFSNQNPILGKFLRVLQWKMLVYFMAIWSICVQPIGIFYCHLVYFIVIWYTLLPFGILYCHLVYLCTAYWYILFPFGISYFHLVYFISIWYILLPFGIFLVIWYIYRVLVCFTMKNLATLLVWWRECVRGRVCV
jgi:hypothetical protein